MTKEEKTAYFVNPEMKEKLCPRCEEVKPVTEFSKHIRRKDGLNQTCKSCVRRYVASRNFKPNPNLKEKLCSICKQVKPVNRFSRSKVKTDGLNSSCYDCRKMYEKQKYKENVNFRLSRIVRRQTQRVVQAAKTNKEASSIDYLGCSIDEFKKHIESQFKEGMNWDNHSIDGWHIDHIKPLSWFIKNCKNPHEANHYTNLQPLWGTENILKGEQY